MHIEQCDASSVFFQLGMIKGQRTSCSQWHSQDFIPRGAWRGHGGAAGESRVTEVSPSSCFKTSCFKDKNQLLQAKEPSRESLEKPPAFLTLIQGQKGGGIFKDPLLVSPGLRNRWGAF